MSGQKMPRSDQDSGLATLTAVNKQIRKRGECGDSDHGHDTIHFNLYCISKIINFTPPALRSNVKPTFFQDRKLSFCCFRSKKDQIYSFWKQNSGSKRNVFYQY
jgi:hypothetical protein